MYNYFKGLEFYIKNFRFKVKTADDYVVTMQAAIFKGEIKKILLFPFKDNLVVTFFLILIFCVLVLHLNTNDKIDEFFKGAAGNITVSVIIGFFFLLLGQRAQKENDKKIKFLAENLEHEQSLKQEEFFIKMMSEHPEFKVRFPGVEDSKGIPLTFYIQPIKDNEGELVFIERRTTSKCYLVKVSESEIRRIREEEVKTDYFMGPLTPGEHYFVGYFNDSWHIGKNMLLTDGYKIYFSGFRATTGYVTSASDIAKEYLGESHIVNSDEYEKLLSFNTCDMKNVEPFHGNISFDLYRQKSSTKLFLVNSKTLNPHYVVNGKGLFSKEEAVMMENIEGYFDWLSYHYFKEGFSKIIDEKNIELETVFINTLHNRNMF